MRSNKLHIVTKEHPAKIGDQYLAGFILYASESFEECAIMDLNHDQYAGETVTY